MDTLKSPMMLVYTPSQSVYKQKLAATSPNTIPSGSDLLALQKELHTVASKATARQKALEKDLAILEDLVRASIESAKSKAAAPKSTPPRKRKREHTVDSASEYSDDSLAKPIPKSGDTTTKTRPPSLNEIKKQTSNPNPKPPKMQIDVKRKRMETVDSVASSAADSTTASEPVLLPPPKLENPVHPSQVTEDFTKVKAPSNQVPIATFYSSIDSYFRPFDERDLQFLRQEDNNVYSFLIPPLGRHYLEVWAEEDRQVTNSAVTGKPFDLLNNRNGGGDASVKSSIIKPVQLTDDVAVNDEIIATNEDLGCGPLTERIMSALVREEIVSDEEGKDDDDEDREKSWKFKLTGGHGSSTVNKDIETVEFEERIRRELRFIGLLGDEDINWSAREDDEVSSTIRTLQRQLREQILDNTYFKQRLHELCLDQMAYQEYCSLLDDIDRQVEQAYLKRNRNTKSKKKKQIGTKNAGLSDAAISAMERRRRLVEGIGPIFTPPERFKLIPQSSVYADKAEWKKNNQDLYL